MSFIVRQISRTADGREIIRPRSFPQAQLTVGRGTENDIHLPDLAVTLHHATITQLAPSRAEIVATAGLPFDVDGRSTERADIDAPRGANIRIGSHVLSVSRGDDIGRRRDRHHGRAGRRGLGCVRGEERE